MAVRNSEMITKGLKNIRNDFVLSNRKEDDAGLTRLIEEYNTIAKKNSNYPDITGEMTGKDIKEAINKMTFEEKLLLERDYKNIIQEQGEKFAREADLDNFGITKIVSAVS